MPANAAVIGRVAVKVIPDTSKFKDELQRQLNGIERSLPKIKVMAELDATSLKRSVIEKVRDINAENKTIKARWIKFKATIDDVGMRGEVTRARRELQRLASAQGIDFRVNNLNAANVSVAVQLDQQALDRVKDEIDRWKRRIEPVKIKVELELQNGAAARIQARLALLTRSRTVNIVPKLDNKALLGVATALAALSGARSLNTLFTPFTNFLKNLDKNVPKIAALSTSILGLLGAGTALASNLFSVGASLATIAPAALALPGIFGGMAIGIGISVAALKDFNTYLPGVAGQLSALQDIISVNFWEPLQKPMQSMVDTIFPILQKSLVGTSAALGGFFAGIATGIEGVLASKLSSMFADLDESIKIATGGTGAFVGIITTLGQVGAGYLPRLAQWFVDISTRFNNFLTSAASDGRLTGWIDTGIEAFKDLGSVLSNLGGILAGISRAAEAAGGSTLNTMAATLERIHATVDSPTFQGGLTNAFRSAHEMMGNITRISGPAISNMFLNLSTMMTGIMPKVGLIIGEVFKMVANTLSNPQISVGLTNMFNGILSGVRALGPAFQSLGPLIGAIMTTIGNFARFLGSLLSAVIPPFAAALTLVLPMVDKLVAALMGGLTNALIALAPTIITVAMAFVSFVQTAVMPFVTAVVGSIIPAVMRLAPLIGSILVQAFATLGPILRQAGQVFAQLVAAIVPLAERVLPILVPALLFLAQIFAGAILGAIKGVILVIQGVTAILGGLIDFVTGVFTGNWSMAWEGIKSVVTGIWDIIKGAFLIFINVGLLGVFRMGFAGLKALAVSGWGAIKAFFTQAGVALRGIVGLLWSALQALFRGGWSVLKTIVSAGWTAIKALFSAGWAVIRSAASAAWSAIRSLFSSAWSAIKSITSAAWSAIKSAFSAGWSALKSAVSAGWSAIKSAFSSGWSAVKSATSAAWSAIKLAFSSAWSSLKSYVSSGWSAIKSSFSSAGSSIRSTVSSLWSSVRSMFSTAWSNLKSAVSTGISGVVSLMRGLPGQAVAALGALGGLFVASGESLIRGLVTGISNMAGAVRDAVGNVLQAARNLLPFSPAKEGPFSGKGWTLYSGMSIPLALAEGIKSKTNEVRKAALSMAEAATVSIPGPEIGSLTAGAQTAARANAALAAGGGGVTESKTLIYHAAPGSSLSSEEDLWSATNRARSAW